jgi:hypothetical protein
LEGERGGEMAYVISPYRVCVLYVIYKRGIITPIYPSPSFTRTFVSFTMVAYGNDGLQKSMANIETSENIRRREKN